MLAALELKDYFVPFLVAISALASGWAVTRTSALSGWRSAAEGYKAQVDEMTGRLEKADEKMKDLTNKVLELEKRPDLSAAINASERNTEKVIKAITQTKDDIVAELRGAM